jgi:ribosome-associated protein
MLGRVVIVIKAQEHRSQEQNREEALQRLQDLVKSAICASQQRFAIALPKPRKPSKTKRSQIKTMRGKVTDE